MDVEIIIRCEDCDAALDPKPVPVWIGRPSHGVVQLMLKPCEKCMDAAIDKAHAAGVAEGADDSAPS